MTRRLTLDRMTAARAADGVDLGPEMLVDVVVSLGLWGTCTQWCQEGCKEGCKETCKDGGRS